MKIFFLFAICIGAFATLAQNDEGRFRISLGSSLNSYKMNELNSFLLDTSTSLPAYYDSAQVRFGTRYGMTISYQFNHLFGFGLEGAYQSAIDKGYPVFVQTDPFTNEVTYQTHYSYVKTSNLSLGLNLSLALDGLLNFEARSNGLKNLGIEVSASGGVGFSELKDSYSNTDFKVNYYKFNHKSTDRYFTTQLKLGYKLTRNPLLTEIGLGIGYQFMKTKPVRNQKGFIYVDQYPEAKEVALDFSGLFYGIYITIGK